MTGEKSKSVTALFEAFWAAYPRRPRNPKAAARAVFIRRIRAGADAAALVRAAERFAAEVKRDKLDPLFVPHARTWLTQCRDEDYPDPAEPAAAVTAPAERDGLWARLADHMAADTYRAWIQPCRVTVDVQPEGAVVRVEAPSRFVADYVRTNLAEALRRGLGTATVEVTVRRAEP